jgi:hypothetical protein
MLNHDTSFLFIAFWISCWALAYGAVHVLLLPTNKPVQTINKWLITLAASVLLGIALSFKIMTALSMAFKLSDMQVAIIGGILLLALIIGTAVATRGVFRVMKEMGANYTKGYY